MTSHAKLRILNALVRPVPQTPEYQERLDEELDLIDRQQLADYFLQVQYILRMCADIPHVTRGSAGSSLVCYLMGITDVDPVRENIHVSRFMNPYRDDYPDIDIDFPYQYQHVVHERVYRRWAGQSARISNYVRYKPASALREAVRRLGFRQRLPARFDLSKIVPGQEAEALEIAESLIGQVKNLSKHCGGILISETNFPKDKLISPTQIAMDKDEVEQQGFLKIDLLANRGLAQIYEIDKMPIHDYPEYDQKTVELLCSAETIGVTQGESPAFRHLIAGLQPKCRNDIIIATALIRPAAASRGKKRAFFDHFAKKRNKGEFIVFEDDATDLIEKIMGCTKYEADMFRRAFAKQKYEKMNELLERVKNEKIREQLYRDLSTQNSYSFCKAHAITLGRLIWALAYQKAHNPKIFWKSTLRHTMSMYPLWVHVEEAKKAGLTFIAGKRPFSVKDDIVTGYGASHQMFPDILADYKKFGYWAEPGFMPGMYAESEKGLLHFCGLLAAGRVFHGENKDITYITIGVESCKLIELVFNGNIDCRNIDVVEGYGEISISYNKLVVQVRDWRFYTVDKWWQKQSRE